MSRDVGGGLKLVDASVDFFSLTASFSFALFTPSDESSELQTQICNGFKSLVAQLQGESPQRPTADVCPSPSRLIFSSSPPTEILNRCKGDFLEMKEGKLKTRPSLLENLVFFVEVRKISTWSLHSVCCTCAPVKRGGLCSPDGVRRPVDGQPLRQGPPAAQDQSTEEEEEEKGRKHGSGAVPLLLTLLKQPDMS